MSKLEAVTYFRLTEFRKPASSPATPMAAPQVAAAPETFIIFFAWDNDVVDTAGSRVIDDAVAFAPRVGLRPTQMPTLLGCQSPKRGNYHLDVV